MTNSQMHSLLAGNITLCDGSHLKVAIAVYFTSSEVRNSSFQIPMRRLEL